MANLHSRNFTCWFQMKHTLSHLRILMSAFNKDDSTVFSWRLYLHGSSSTDVSACPSRLRRPSLSWSLCHTVNSLLKVLHGFLQTHTRPFILYYLWAQSACNGTNLHAVTSRSFQRGILFKMHCKENMLKELLYFLHYRANYKVHCQWVVYFSTCVIYKAHQTISCIKLFEKSPSVSLTSLTPCNMLHMSHVRVFTIPVTH